MRHHLLTGYHRVRGGGIPLLRGAQGRVVRQLVNSREAIVNHSNNPIITALTTKVIGTGAKMRSYRPLRFK